MPFTGIKRLERNQFNRAGLTVSIRLLFFFVFSHLDPLFVAESSVLYIAGAKVKKIVICKYIT